VPSSATRGGSSCSVAGALVALGAGAAEAAGSGAVDDENQRDKLKDGAFAASLDPHPTASAIDAIAQFPRRRRLMPDEKLPQPRASPQETSNEGADRSDKKKEAAARAEGGDTTGCCREGLLQLPCRVVLSIISMYWE
jgi:hypothetical protein